MQRRELTSNGERGSRPRGDTSPSGMHAKKWLDEKPNLRQRSREQYEINLRSTSSRSSATPNSQAHAGDGSDLASQDALRRETGFCDGCEVLSPPACNPCHRGRGRIDPRESLRCEGASTERPPERPVATIEQVYAMADAIGPRCRVIVLFAAFTGFRLGELRGLRRNRLTWPTGPFRLSNSTRSYRAARSSLAPRRPTPAADGRDSPAMIPDLIEASREVMMSRPTRSGFLRNARKPLHRKTFYRNWNQATEAAGLAGFHFHDLRHTGNTLAATTGACTKELMNRMGHASAPSSAHLPTRQQGAGCCPCQRSPRVDCGVHAQARRAENEQSSCQKRC